MTDKKIDVASGFMPDDFPYNNEIASSFNLLAMTTEAGSER